MSLLDKIGLFSAGACFAFVVEAVKHAIGW